MLSILAARLRPIDYANLGIAIAGLIPESIREYWCARNMGLPVNIVTEVSEENVVSKAESEVEDVLEKSILEWTPEEQRKMHRKLQREYEKESPLKSCVGKRVLAESLATMVVHQRILIELEMKGELDAEEARTLPSVASNIKRLTADLKLSVAVKEDDGFGDAGE